MNILKNISLKPYNTFGLDVRASEYVEISNLNELRELIPTLAQEKYLFLGGGSNVLFLKDFDGLVIRNNIKGISSAPIDRQHDLVSVHSGEIWHEFVLWSLEAQCYGLENLSLIPGTVGAAPMQNIGAYGVEIKDVCSHVDAIDLQTGELRTFTNEQCQFGYRESIFKRSLRNQFFIFCVHFKLSKTPHLHMEYGAIKNVLKSKKIVEPTPRDISDAIISIRSSKLPDPKVLGNAGSFFKNPVITKECAANIQTQYPQVPTFTDKLGVKIPAGWLIEQAGFKGEISGHTGSHKDQALVIVNYGQATGQEIYDYSSEIITKIEEQFGITLEREVNII